MMETKPLIDWEVISQAMQKSSRARLQWASKQATGFLEKMLSIGKCRPNAECSQCGHMEKDKVHVLQCCNDFLSLKAWHSAVEVLEQCLVSNKTELGLSQYMLS